MAKTPKWTKVGTDGAYDLYDAKGVKVSKNSEGKTPFQFRVPSTVQFPGLSASDAKIYQKILMEGAWAAEARSTKLANDTTIVVNGETIDMFSLTPRRMARYLNAFFTTLKAARTKNADGSVNVEDTKQSKKLDMLAKHAVARGAVKDNGPEIDTLEAERFEPLSTS